MSASAPNPSNPNANGPARSLPVKWDTAKVWLEKPGAFNWGIGADAEEKLNRILANHMGQPDPVFPLPAAVFRQLLKLFWDNGIDTTEINRAIDLYLQQQAPPPEDTRNLIRMIQEKMQALFPKDIKSPVTIVADGIWGPASEAAFRFIRETYLFVPEERNQSLINVLDGIAGHLVAFTCNDELLLERTLYNPFAWIGKEPSPYEWKLKGNGASLFSKFSGAELAAFHSYLRSDKNDEPLFVRFCVWMTLLQLKKVILITSEWNLQVSFQHGTAASGSINGLPVPTAGSFMIQPEGVVTADSYTVQLQVSWPDMQTKKADCIAIWHSGDFRYTLSRGYRTTTADGEVFTFDSEYFFRDTDYLVNENLPARALMRADYVQLFLTKPGLLDEIPSSLSYKAVAGADQQPELCKLLTCDPSDLYAIHTIGLQLAVAKETTNTTPVKTVLIAGTGRSRIPALQRKMSEAIAGLLAENSIGLICGGWPGVDQAAAKAYANKREAKQLPLQGFLLQLLENDQEALSETGTVERLPANADWYKSALDKADAVVLIGGLGGTYYTYQLATKRNIPVFPIPATAGDALKAYNQMKDIPDPLIGKENLDALQEYGEDPERLATHILNVLLNNNTKTAFSPKLTKKEFETIVKKIYAEATVTVADDLQKNRWGGDADNNGKVLRAQVSNAGDHLYSVTFTVRSITGTPLSGQVAFFLHDSFDEEVIITEAVNGEAQITVSAYETFTAGVYTEDGTRLELDLEELEGLPNKFYATDPAKRFKDQVKSLLDTTPVTVKDDLQKNRWGKKAKNNGKELSATVTRGLVPGFFKVKLEVKSTTPGKPLEGHVAFLLHDTFVNSVRYKKTKDGVAGITVSAFEAFTAAAFTEDGVMLELDLQKQKGFPAGFYYKETRVRKKAPVAKKKSVKKKATKK